MRDRMGIRAYQGVWGQNIRRLMGKAFLCQSSSLFPNYKSLKHRNLHLVSNCAVQCFPPNARPFYLPVSSTSSSDLLEDTL